MVKINVKFTELKNEFKKGLKVKLGKITIHDKSYTIVKIEKEKWQKSELIGRRLLGGFLTAITFGLLYLFKPVKELFQKTKAINVTAVLNSQTKEPAPKLRKAKDSKPPETQDTSASIKDPTGGIPTSQTPDALILSLPSELQSEIAAKLPIRDLFRLEQTSKTMEAIAKKTFQEKELELFAEIIQKNEKGSPEYKKMLKAFDDDPHRLLQFIILLDSHYPHSNQFAIHFDLQRLIRKNLFSEHFLSKCAPADADKLLALEIKYKGKAYQQIEIQPLFFKYASSQTFVDFVKAACEDRSIFGKTEAWLDRIEQCFDATNPLENGEMQDLIIEFFIRKFDVLSFHGNARTRNEAFTWIEKKIPNLSIDQLARHDHTHLSIDQLAHYEHTLPFYLGWKLVQLCRSPVTDQELRVQFRPLFQASYNTAYSRENFCRVFRKNYSDFWRTAPRHQQPAILRRCVYAINGLGHIDQQLPYLNIYNLVNTYRNLVKPEVVQAALKEWMHSCQDSCFLGEVAAPFHVIDSKELLEALVDEALTFDEPLKSFHLRALAQGRKRSAVFLDMEKEKVELPDEAIAEVFANHGLEVPQGAITPVEILIHASALKDFIQSVKQIKTTEQLEALIQEIVKLPPKQQSVRLRAVAHSVWLPDVGKEIRNEKVFASNGLNIQDFPPILENIPLNDTLEKFYQTTGPEALTKALQEAKALGSPEREEELRRLSHLEFQPLITSPLTELERKSIFEKHGLKWESFPPLSPKEFIAEEANAFDPKTNLPRLEHDLLGPN